MDPAVATGADPNFLIFLLIGQSNMEGAPASEAQDRTPDPRIKVLALRDCAQRNQVRNQWYTAVPSLHTCGNTLGPGDYFARTLAAALPNVTIGLVPDAIAGVVNIVLKGSGRGGSITARYGQYTAGDGEQYQVSGGAGFSTDVHGATFRIGRSAWDGRRNSPGRCRSRAGAAIRPAGRSRRLRRWSAAAGGGTSRARGR